MGIIARQSSKKTIISFVGVLIGAISILFIYPNDKETYGLALFLFSMSNLLMIIISLGSHGLIIKYYPVFEKMKRAGFISLILMVVIFCVLLMSGLLYLLKPFFYKLLELLDFRLEQIKDNAKNLAIKNIIKLDAMTSDQVSLNTYNIEFYTPKDIYLNQIDIFDNRSIYKNFDLVQYRNNDIIGIKNRTLQELNINKQRILIELKELKNG